MKDNYIRVSDPYHKIYEKHKLWSKNTWMGVPCWKLPMDAFVIQELIVKTLPEFIIETGTGRGGSASFYASICELLGQGNVITVDIEDKAHPDMFKYIWGDRINTLIGDSTDKHIFKTIYEQIGGREKCMVILDSWHTEEHVYKEMCMYSDLVPVGGYMIVEDSHVDGNPVKWKWNDRGPMGAIDRWMEENFYAWEIDTECEKHEMTFNPNGYLKRVK
jgi:cephalosporin hydroxylase